MIDINRAAPGRSGHSPAALLVSSGLLVAGLACAPPATAEVQGLGGAGADHASCLGSGSAFYGTFAPRQRAFVAAFVIDSSTAGASPGEVYREFAQEKEGGAIPEPCGTRLE